MPMFKNRKLVQADQFRLGFKFLNKTFYVLFWDGSITIILNNKGNARNAALQKSWKEKARTFQKCPKKCFQDQKLILMHYVEDSILVYIQEKNMEL